MNVTYKSLSNPSCCKYRSSAFMKRIDIHGHLAEWLTAIKPILIHSDILCKIYHYVK